VLPPSTTTLTSSANPSFAGSAVTFTATVIGTIPIAGTVNFTSDAVSIPGCSAVFVTSSTNLGVAACVTSGLAVGTRAIVAAYSGNGSNAPSSSTSLSQSVLASVPGTATIVANPYGALTVLGATLVGNTITNFSNNVTIKLGPTPGGPGIATEIDFQGLNLGPNGQLSIWSGAPNQFVYLVDKSGSPSLIAGVVATPYSSGFLPPILYVKNPNGLTIAAGGAIADLEGTIVDTLGATFTSGSALINQGAIDAGYYLEIRAAAIHGGGEFRGDAITIRTFGNANNPVNGAFFLQNGLHLQASHTPSPTTPVSLAINAYGSAPQFINFNIFGSASVWMPSAWPAGSGVPANNQVVAPQGVRAAGVPDPSYGGGSIIVQSAGSIALLNGGTNDFVFPGGIVFKAATAIDTAGVLVNQGWTTTGQAFQGTFFEAPQIGSSVGFIQSYTNNLNWVNFSTFPITPVRAFQLVRNGNGTASFVPSDLVTPHLNTYSVLINAAALGQCWTCLVNPLPVNMFGP
jgi:hypothetical protein